MTREQAILDVESAAWDEYNSGLSGAEIWGSGGSDFQVMRATSNFTYESALRAIDTYFGAEA